MLEPAVRLERHLEKYYGKNKFTAKVVDWQLYFFFGCVSRKQAKKIEQHIKRIKSKKYIQNLKKYPEISKRLIEKYP